MDNATAVEPKVRNVLMAAFWTALIVIALIAGVVGAFRLIIGSPSGVQNPNGEASGYAYERAEEGLHDSQHGVKDADDLDIIGYCAAAIPDIKAALADGKLTNQEVHDLKAEAEQLQDQYDFAVEKNKALATMGKPLVPEVDCHDGKALFAEIN